MNRTLLIAVAIAGLSLGGPGMALRALGQVPFGPRADEERPRFPDSILKMRSVPFAMPPCAVSSFRGRRSDATGHEYTPADNARRNRPMVARRYSEGGPPTWLRKKRVKFCLSSSRPVLRIFPLYSSAA